MLDFGKEIGAELLCSVIAARIVGPKRNSEGSCTDHHVEITLVKPGASRQ
jgi:hypothetical protein